MKTIIFCLSLTGAALLSWWALENRGDFSVRGQSPEGRPAAGLSPPPAAETAPPPAGEISSAASPGLAAVAPVRPVAAPEAAAAVRDRIDRTDTLSTGEQRSLQRAFDEARRKVRPIPAPWADRPESRGYSHYANHSGQNLRARFGPGVAQFTSSSRPHVEAGEEDVSTTWEARMRLVSFAGQSVASSAAPMKPENEGTRVNFRHTANLSEWYINREEGIEHGFTVASRPGHLDGDKPVEIHVALEGVDADRADQTGGALVFRDGDRSVLSYAKLEVIDAAGRQLEARMGATGDGFVLAYNDRGAVYPVTVDPLITSEEQRLTVSDGDSREEFGSSVAISGDTIVVGAPSDDNGSGRFGSAYVFTRSGTAWSEEQKLTASDAENVGRFGDSVSISGDTIVVINVVSAYVFTRSGTAWSEEQKLTLTDAGGGGVLITAVAVCGDTLVVGASRTDDMGENSGSAYVFTRSGTVWSEEQKLTASDAAVRDYFGGSVGVSGDTLVVGAVFGDVGGGVSGSAYVFTRSGTVWSEEQELTAGDGEDYDYFGGSVGISGDTVVVGSASDDEGGNISSGSAYVFTRSGTVWSEEQKLIASDAQEREWFGDSVAISGDKVVVGSRWRAANGSAYVFTRSGTVWSEEQKLTASDAAARYYFGSSVGISGDTVVVGADGDRFSGSGSAYVFRSSGTDWSEEQKLAASDAGVGGVLPIAVVVSGDTAVVGAHYGIHQGSLSRNASGSAYVFRRSGTVWSEEQKLIASDAGYGDQFGSSVGISGDTVVVGAPRSDDGDFSNSGRAYVFRRSGTVWSEEQKMTASDAGGGDRFGSSVGISGDTLVVGSRPASSSSGGAYVFRRSGTAWAEEQKLASGDGEAIDWFGWSVAVSGDTVVVGAPGPGLGGERSGSAYVFRRSGMSWTEEQQMSASGAAANGFWDFFGGAVGISGDTVVVGAANDDDGGIESGSAHVFTRSGRDWSEEQKLTAGDAVAHDHFGWSVGISGDTVVVGNFADRAVVNDPNEGSAYLFTRRGAVWNEEQELTFSSSYRPRITVVAISGDTIVVGVYNDHVDEDGDARPEPGSAHVFRTALDGQSHLQARDWRGDVLHHGASAAVFGGVALGASEDYVFEIGNVGTVGLDVQSVSLGGTDPGSFRLDVPDLTPVPDLGHGEGLAYTITFDPVGAASGPRAATVTLTSNSSDGATLSFGISGLALFPTDDADGDGLNDLAEHRLRGFGFDWQVSQPNRVADFYEFASLADLYTREEVGGMQVNVVLVQVDPATRTANLVIGLAESDDLDVFAPILADPAKLSVDGEGRINYEVDASADKKFFRVEFP